MPIQKYSEKKPIIIAIISIFAVLGIFLATIKTLFS